MLAAALGKGDKESNKRIAVIDSEGAPRSVTQDELNKAPAGKYKLVSADNQERKQDAADEKNFAQRIQQKEKQAGSLFGKEKTQAQSEIAAMKQEYESRFGKSYGGATTAPANDPLGIRKGK